MNFLTSSAVAVIFAVCISISTSAEENNAETAAEATDSYVSPKPSGNVYFAEHFDSEEEFEARWVRSQAKKDGIDETIAKYDGKWAVELPLKGALKGDMGLVLKSKAKHAAISASLDKPFYFTDKALIVQYEVTFQSGQDCGGAYLKLLTHSPELRLSQFTDKTQYTIMFGPDKCGNDQKLHFIFQHKNPKNGTFSEKHAKKASVKLDDYFKDGKPHLYTLMVHPDNTYYISVDYKIVNQGTLLDDFTPPVNPPAEIDDPEDRKPEDWDEREKIPDPEAKKPDDWDEDQPERVPDSSAVKPSGWLDDESPMIPDPNAEKPEDWDEDMDGIWEAPLIDNPACQSAPGCGEWEAPLIANPLFKGKWRPPLIDNPDYKGKWHPRRIPNPDFFEDKHPFNMEPIGAVGLELWSMSDNILFDNFVITDDKRVAEDWAAATFDFRNKVISDQDSVVERLIKYTRNRPWLWAVYVLVIGIPAVLIISFLCTSQEQKEKIRAARAKKDEDEAAAEDDQQPAAEEAEQTPPEEAKEEEAKEEEEEAEEVETPEEAPREEKQSPRRRRTRKD